MAGIGKTELVLQYVRTYWEFSYPGGVCWLEARDQDIATQILTFSATHFDLYPSEDLPLEARIAYCWNHWPEFITEKTPSSASVLVVVDDVSTYESIEPYLPKSSRFYVLITTRRQHISSTAFSFDIAVLTEEASLTLLRQLAGEKRINADIEKAQFLCNWLGYLPLALELSGLYLSRKPALSLQELQSRLEAQYLSARALTKTQSGMTNSLGVASAFELSWKDIKNETIKELAFSMSLFGASSIPWSLLEACFPEQDPELLEEGRDEYLLNLSLLYYRGEDRYQMHQLIREFIRGKYSDVAQSEGLKSKVANTLALESKNIPEDVTQQDLENIALAIPHIEEASNTLVGSVDKNLFTHLFQGVGRYYQGKGRYDLAESTYQNFRSHSEKEFGYEHVHTLQSLGELATVFYICGEYDQAEDLQRSALSSRLFEKDALPVLDNLVRADMLNGLGLTLTAKEGYEEAEKMFIASLEIRQDLLGSDHPDVSDSFNNMALLLSAQGEHQKAEELLKKSLKIRRKVFSSKHPRIATSLNNLASSYYNQNRLKEAEDLYLEALSLYRSLHDNEHRDTAKALNNSAQVKAERGDYKGAEPLFLEALEIQQSILGEEHPEIAFSLNNIAALYEDLGRVDEAEDFYLKALKMREEILGENHSFVAITVNNIAKLYQNTQRYAEAEPLYRRAVATLEENLESDHPILLKVKSNLDSLLLTLEQSS